MTYTYFQVTLQQKVNIYIGEVQLFCSGVYYIGKVKSAFTGLLFFEPEDTDLFEFTASIAFWFGSWRSCLPHELDDGDDTRHPKSSQQYKEDTPDIGDAQSSNFILRLRRDRFPV